MKKPVRLSWATAQPWSTGSLMLAKAGAAVTISFSTYLVSIINRDDSCSCRCKVGIMFSYIIPFKLFRGVSFIGRCAITAEITMDMWSCYNWTNGNELRCSSDYFFSPLGHPPPYLIFFTLFMSPLWLTKQVWRYCTRTHNQNFSLAMIRYRRLYST
jgi:hypothetical protein